MADPHHTTVPNTPAGVDSLPGELARSERLIRLGTHLRRATLVSLGVLCVFGFVSGYLATVGYTDCTVDEGRTCRVTRLHPFTVQPHTSTDYRASTETRHGAYRAWYPSGQLAHSGEYENGLKAGPWREWWSDGTPRFEGTYRRGRLDGRETWWYANGLPEWTGEWKDGVRNGTEIWWHENGQLRRVGGFENGHKSGRFTVWNPDGQLAFTKVHEPRTRREAARPLF